MFLAFLYNFLPQIAQKCQKLEVVDFSTTRCGFSQILTNLLWFLSNFLAKPHLVACQNRTFWAFGKNMSEYYIPYMNTSSARHQTIYFCWKCKWSRFSSWKNFANLFTWFWSFSIVHHYKRRIVFYNWFLGIMGWHINFNFYVGNGWNLLISDLVTLWELDTWNKIIFIVFEINWLLSDWRC